MKTSLAAIARTSNWFAELGHPDPFTAAKAHVALGLPVFPLHSLDGAGRCSCGTNCGRNAGKHPRTHKGLLDATWDPRPYPIWWRSWPQANVAVATGAAAGVWVLDVDPHHGGLESLERLEAAHGEAAANLVRRDRRQGLHLWFASGDAALRNSAGRLAPGLDVRAEGGYVIVPPSRHRSGLTYRWATSGIPLWSTSLPHHRG